MVDIQDTYCEHAYSILTMIYNYPIPTKRAAHRHTHSHIDIRYTDIVV